MKLPHKKSAVLTIAHWHPDFRDVASLPDLKVVRTSFFVNVVCVTIAVIVLLATSYREYDAFNMRSEIETAELAIAANSARNTELLAINKEFSDADRRFKEADKFQDAPFVASELLMALSRTLPTYMDFTRITYEAGVLALSGTIRGASESASTRVSEYRDVLRADPLVGTLFPDVSIKSLDRDPRTQGLSFQLLLKAVAPGTAPKS